MKLSPTRPEVDDRAAAATREAVPEVFLLVHTKAHAGVVVEGTIAAILRVEVNILADERFDGNGGFEALRDRSVSGWRSALNRSLEYKPLLALRFRAASLFGERGEYFGRDMLGLPQQSKLLTDCRRKRLSIRGDKIVAFARQPMDAKGQPHQRAGTRFQNVLLRVQLDAFQAECLDDAMSKVSCDLSWLLADKEPQMCAAPRDLKIGGDNLGVKL